jgi:hypothetical protein
LSKISRATKTSIIYEGLRGPAYYGGKGPYAGVAEGSPMSHRRIVPSEAAERQREASSFSRIALQPG